MKKNTRLLAVLLVLTMPDLTFTACASSSKMAAYEQSASEASYDTASWETSSVEAPAATANEDFKMEAPAEEAEYEEGALATTTAVTQDEAPRLRQPTLPPKSSTRRTSPPRPPTLTRQSRRSTRRLQPSAASSNARTSTAIRAIITTARPRSSTAGRITPSVSPLPALKSSCIRPRASETLPPSAATQKT